MAQLGFEHRVQVLSPCAICTVWNLSLIGLCTVLSWEKSGSLMGRISHWASSLSGHMEMEQGDLPSLSLSGSLDTQAEQSCCLRSCLVLDGWGFSSFYSWLITKCCKEETEVWRELLRNRSGGSCGYQEGRTPPTSLALNLAPLKVSAAASVGPDSWGVSNRGVCMG